jgi:hypothetical protein
MLGVTALCVVFCIGTHIEGGQPLRPDGEIELYGGDHKPLTGPNPIPGRLRECTKSQFGPIIQHESQTCFRHHEVASPGEPTS